MNHTLFGIDYGSKLSGNTVISILKNTKIYFLDVDENVDADQFILNAARHFEPDVITLNAPLSLPGVYCQTDGCSNHQFRKADEELCTVSPMVIGGLTARAIELKAQIEKELPTKVFETCSKAQAKNYDLCNLGYKKNKMGLLTCRNVLSSKLNPNIMFNCMDIKSWNHIDAFLALISSMRIVTGHALPFGDEKEGLVYV